MRIKPGDIFCVTGDSIVQSAIKGCTSIFSTDGSAEYGHVGIITHSNGNTFEAVETYSRHNIYSRYSGCDILVGRHVDMDTISFTMGMRIVKKFEGKMYPWFRIGVFLVPFLPKFMHFGKPVCSELAFMFLHDLRDCGYHWGVTPDYVADAIKRWDVFDVIYDGQF